MGKILWLDVETTGKDPQRNDIITLAAIVEIDGTDRDSLHIKMAPPDGAPVDLEALEVNGLTMEDLHKFPPAKEGLRHLEEFMAKWIDRFDKLDKFVPAGYYVRFDLDFLRGLFEKQRNKYFGSWFTNVHIDVATVVAECYASFRFRPLNFKLTTICEYFEITFDGQAHDALSDVKATRTLYRRLRGLE